MRTAAGAGPNLNDRVTVLWRNVRMSDEHDLTSRHADQARADFRYGNELDFIKTKLAQLQTRPDLARTALLVSLAVTARVIAWIELFSRDCL